MNPLLQNRPGGNGNMLQQFQQFKKMLGTQDPQQLLNELMAMMNGFNNVNSSLCQGFGGVQESINNLSHQMEQCCCNLKTQMMQDKYDALKTQYDQSLQAISNSVQTHNILSQLGRYYTNPPYYPQYGTYYPAGATVA